MRATIALARQREAPAPNRGLFVWWTPARIAYHDGQGWRTVAYPKYQHTANIKQSQTAAVSPIGTDGLCHFIAWDVDDNDPQTVRKLIAPLPPGCRPLVSFSGKKGWHLWLFPDRPLPTRVCVAFAKLVRDKAGIVCEVFPTSKSSKCLKWPGSLHPETGKAETFVREDDLTTEYDTAAVLEGLAGGEWRTPAEVITAYVAANAPAGKRTMKKTGVATKPQTTAKQQSLAINCNQLRAGGKLLPDGTNFATIPEIALGLAQLCGRHVKRIGQGFRCILPGHEERRPSAAFCYGDNGTIVYHCFHHEKHGTPEFLTLGEAAAAVFTGQIQKLSPVEAARWLAALAIRLGFRTQLAIAVEERLISLKQTTSNIFTGCSPRGDWGIVYKVWEVVEEEALLQAMGGFEEISLSARFLARMAKVKVEQANKAVNLLCVLGLLEKVPGSGGMKGDRFTLGNVSVEEARRRLNALFPNGRVDLRKFNRELVAKKLGEELAAKVFRRQGETVKETATQTVSETVPQTVNGTVTQTVRSLLAEIQVAEAVGDWERVKHLQRLFMEEVRKSKGRPAEILWSSSGIPLQYLWNTFAIP